MSAVEVEISEEETSGSADAGGSRKSDAADAGDRSGEGRRRRRSGADVEVEREVTKRELIRSASNILVVILYMIFTLLRDRDAGVIVIDDDETDADDWQE